MTEETDILDIPEDEYIEENIKQTSRSKPWIFGFCVVLGAAMLAGVWLYHYLQIPPKNFPVNTPIVIELGTGTKQALHNLKEAGFIRSTLSLYLELRLAHEGKTIKAGTYIFNGPLSVGQLATALTEGDPTSDLLRLTLIEGESAKQIAARAAAVLPEFDTQAFLTLADGHEGKLFPETYLIPETYTANDLFSLLESTFIEKIAGLEAAVTTSEFTLEEIIILASILEREANTGESMRIVSGILQNRLSIGMALQVDASMEYVLDKPLSELTPEDLEIDSPYNTYLYPGLPPTAIGNPGVEAIEAILNPEPSNYMFYITGNDGNFYYARDFDEHRDNIARYLR